jgi:hypothetical protein
MALGKAAAETPPRFEKRASHRVLAQGRRRTRAFFSLMLRIAESFHDASLVEDEDAIGAIEHEAEIVSDENQGEAATPPLFFEEIEKLEAMRRVQLTRGFVGDEQEGVVQEGGGQRDALQLPPGHLVRQSGAESGGFRESQLSEPPLDDPIALGTSAGPLRTRDAGGVIQLTAEGKGRMKAAVGILKDPGQAQAGVAPHGAGSAPIFAGEAAILPGAPKAIGQEVAESGGRQRFSGAAAPRDQQGLTRIQGEIDIGDEDFPRGRAHLET